MDTGAIVHENVRDLMPTAVGHRFGRVGRLRRPIAWPTDNGGRIVARKAAGPQRGLHGDAAVSRAERAKRSAGGDRHGARATLSALGIGFRVRFASGHVPSRARRLSAQPAGRGGSVRREVFVQETAANANKPIPRPTRRSCGGARAAVVYTSALRRASPWVNSNISPCAMAAICPKFSISMR